MKKLDLAQVTISHPTIEIGENRYLRHYVYEITLGEDLVIGHAFTTLYHYSQAAKDKVLYSWMARPDTYTEHNQQFMLEPTSKYADLPVTLYENISSTHGYVLMLDEVTVMPEYRESEAEQEAVRQVVNYWTSRTDAILVPDFGPMARYISGINTPINDFWEALGFHGISEIFMIHRATLSKIDQDQKARV